MVEFLVGFINAFILSSQRFNPSKFPAYASSSHQRRYTFGPGRGPKQGPNGSFVAIFDGYMERPRPSPVWIAHEVKQEIRKHVGPQLKRQEACEFAAWAYEIRDELGAELARTQYACFLVSPS
jgi:hypothetical protein